jgi:hypothetical protein
MSSKGAEPVPAWRVLSARDVESRFAATRTGSAAPLVGRQEEMGLLLRAWDGSCHGRGQVVLIQGEAGVGKSRLVEGLREAAGKEHIWVAIRCSPFHTASAFYPIIEHLKRVFGWQPEDTAQQHLAKLEAGLAGFKTLSRSESVRLFADLPRISEPRLNRIGRGRRPDWRERPGGPERCWRAARQPRGPFRRNAGEEGRSPAGRRRRSAARRHSSACWRRYRPSARPRSNWRVRPKADLQLLRRFNLQLKYNEAMPGQLEARRATRRQAVGSDRVDLLPVDDLDTGKLPVKKDREKMLD